MGASSKRVLGAFISIRDTTPILWRKYASLIRIIINLGIRENPYTWPTCTCPIKTGGVRISEIWEIAHGAKKPDKRNLIRTAQNNARQTTHGDVKRHLEEDSPSNEQAPTKRIKLVPNARPAETRSTIQEPPVKKGKRRTSKKKNRKQHSCNYFRNYNKTTATQRFPGTTISRTTTQEQR